VAALATASQILKVFPTRWETYPARSGAEKSKTWVDPPRAWGLPPQDLGIHWLGRRTQPHHLGQHTQERGTR